MGSIIKVSEAASLALHTMKILAAEPGRSVTVSGAAKSLSVSAAHLAKVLQRLVHARLVLSARGPTGGFRLGRPAAEIRLLDVYEAVEGRLVDAECLFGKPKCAQGQCMFGGLLHGVIGQVRARLEGTTLADVVRGRDEPPA